VISESAGNNFTELRPAARDAGLHNRVVLFRWRNVSFATFGAFAGLGGAAASALVIARQAQAGLAPARFALALWVGMPLAVIVGSRALALAQHSEELRRSPLRTLFAHGFAFQGGLLSVIAGFALLAWAYRLDLLALLDTAVLGLPLGHALGRLGCHTFGCCHGRPSRNGPVIRYTNPESKAVWRSGLRGVPLYPTQLYSAGGNLALFVLLSCLALRPLGVGQLSATYLVVGSAGRLLIERLRGVPAPRRLGLTAYQWIALATLIAGFALLAWTLRGAPRLSLEGSLSEAMRASVELVWAPIWVFGALSLVFGIHGRRIGGGA
jgi:phosphatidylglycerol:prolipoprotein diacylglycerol transferase